MCYVANGSADIYYEYGMHVWDIAAGSLIAREAGCLVLDPNGSELDLLKRRVIVASSKELADQVIPLLEQLDHDQIRSLICIGLELALFKKYLFTN